DHRDSGGATGRPGAGLAGPWAGLERHYAADARERLRLGGVVAFQRATEHRTPLDRRDEHPGDLEVDSERGAPVHFDRRIEPRRPGAEQAKVLRILEL